MLRAHVAGCRWFWAWALLGSVAALGFVSLGVLVLAPVVAAGVLMASKPAIRRSAFGLLTGAGILLLFVGGSNEPARARRAGRPRPQADVTSTSTRCRGSLSGLRLSSAASSVTLGAAEIDLLTPSSGGRATAGDLRTSAGTAALSPERSRRRTTRARGRPGRSGRRASQARARLAARAAGAAPRRSPLVSRLGGATSR